MKTKDLSEERINQIHELLNKLKVNYKKITQKSNSSQNSLSLINEALTHTSANAEINHERLEFLGDAVLRLVASEFIDRKFPNMTVGDRSALRSQLVSDKWLTNVGRELEITKLMIIGQKAIRDNSAKATLEAEATEALIGALYECLGDLNAIHQWLTPHWEKTSSDVLNDPDKKNSKSALQEWSQKKGCKLPKYLSEEKSQKHGDPFRFFCKVHLDGNFLGEGWGGSRQEAEKAAAFKALQQLRKIKTLKVKS